MFLEKDVRYFNNLIYYVLLITVLPGYLGAMRVCLPVSFKLFDCFLKSFFLIDGLHGNVFCRQVLAGNITQRLETCSPTIP